MTKAEMEAKTQIVWYAILQLKNETNNNFINFEDIVKHTNIDEQTAKNCIKKLAKQGKIKTAHKF